MPSRPLRAAVFVGWVACGAAHSDAPGGEPLAVASNEDGPVASRPLELSAPGGMTLRARPSAALDVAGVEEPGRVAFAGALGPGTTLYRQPYGAGFEDFVRFAQRPDRERVEYALELENVSGLRLIGNVLELLDEGGAPRLRVNAPFVSEESTGRTVPLRVSLEGCRADTSPQTPWGRPVVAPGASTCTLAIEWSGVAYPAVVDPIWHATSAPSQSYGRHTATLLSDGRVLASPDNATASEIYDPSTDTWAMTGPHSAAHFNGTATLLADGSVLAVSYVCERFDPALGTWALTPTTLKSRQHHTATRLPDGRLLVAGGDDDLFATAEIYEQDASDPTEGTWSIPAPMVELRFGATATLLQSGRVLVIGGNGPSPGAQFTAEIYDPASESWQPTVGPLQRRRIRHDSVLLPDGRVAVLGGEAVYFGMSGATVEIFDPTTGLFALSPVEMQAHHAGGAAVVMANGFVLIAGGNAPSEVLPEDGTATEIFDATSGAVHVSAPMSLGRFEPTATLLPSGDVLLVGGESSELFRLDGVGTVCVGGGDCASGLCVDGVCCDTPCDGVCEACSNAKKGIGADGTCAPVMAGLDPKNACPSQLVSTCGLSGSCDGAGQCAPYPAGTLCATPTCDGGMATAPTCDGVGACVASSSLCAPYACSGGGCASTCKDDAGCAEGAYCAVDETCRPRRPVGGECTTPAECASSACVAGLCSLPGTCRDDATFVGLDGAPVDCAPFACTPNGCADACTSILQCASPAVCREDGTCGLTTTAAPSVGCQMDEGGRGGDRLPALLAAALLALATRRRRK